MVHMIAGRAGSGKSRRMYEMAEAAMEAGVPRERIVNLLQEG